MTQPLTHCPNCGTAWPPGGEVCPHCGFVRPAPAGAAWPPVPAGRNPSGPPWPYAPVAPRNLTGAAWGDVVLGLGLSLGSLLLVGLGFVLMPILYFTLRPKYPALARGMGYGLLAGAAVLLGAVAWCFYGISKNGL